VKIFDVCVFLILFAFLFQSQMEFLPCGCVCYLSFSPAKINRNDVRGKEKEILVRFQNNIKVDPNSQGKTTGWVNQVKKK
jgi:hypothetical protein